MARIRWDKAFSALPKGIILSSSSTFTEGGFPLRIVRTILTSPSGEGFRGCLGSWVWSW